MIIAIQVKKMSLVQSGKIGTGCTERAVAVAMVTVVPASYANKSRFCAFCYIHACVRCVGAHTHNSHD